MSDDVAAPPIALPVSSARGLADCSCTFDEARGVWLEECAVFHADRETAAPSLSCAWCGFVFREAFPPRPRLRLVR
jgi:hypothetical protein